ncbi:MAG: PIN domain-containing protein [Pseudomonadales bacterium]|nr:PIN domain-containing protein [Pseudomonadales bacterium]
MILVDSSVWIDYFNGTPTTETDFLDSILGVEPLGIGDLILTEVLQGFRSDSEYRKVKDLMLELTLFELLGRDRAVRAADSYRALRKKGVTIRKTNDLIIGTYCVDESLPLLFRDRDFQPMIDHMGLRSALA